jgi:N-acyl-D-amino-acid deacylase
MLINLESKVHPFSHHPSYAEIAGLPLAAKLKRMRDPAMRARLLAEQTTNENRFWRPRMLAFDKMFPLGNPPDYEPGPERSVAALGLVQGFCREDVIVQELLEPAAQLRCLRAQFEIHGDPTRSGR